MKQILNKLSKELNLSTEIITKVYSSYWKFIHNTIENLPLKKDLSEQEFNKLKTNFSIPNLGKLHCTYPRYISIKTINKKIKDAEDKES